MTDAHYGLARQLGPHCVATRAQSLVDFIVAMGERREGSVPYGAKLPASDLPAFVARQNWDDAWAMYDLARFVVQAAENADRLAGSFYRPMLVTG